MLHKLIVHTIENGLIVTLVVMINAILFFLPGDLGLITLALWVAHPSLPLGLTDDLLHLAQPIRYSRAVSRFTCWVGIHTDQEPDMHSSCSWPSRVGWLDVHQPGTLAQIVRRVCTRDPLPDELTPSPWRRAGGAWQAAYMRRKMKQRLCSLWSLLIGMIMTHEETRNLGISEALQQARPCNLWEFQNVGLLLKFAHYTLLSFANWRSFAQSAAPIQ